MDNTHKFIKEAKEIFSSGREDTNYPQNLEASVTFPFVVNFEGKDIGCIYLNNYQTRIGLIDMSHFRIYEQQKGYGSKLLNKLCQLADKHKVLIYIFPVVDDQSTMSLNKLKSWYREFGFVGDISMEREPKA